MAWGDLAQAGKVLVLLAMKTQEDMATFFPLLQCLLTLPHTASSVVFYIVNGSDNISPL